jgi:hypothetical protein
MHMWGNNYPPVLEDEDNFNCRLACECTKEQVKWKREYC